MELSSSHQLQKNNICLLCGSLILFSDQALLSFECVTGVPKLATVESVFDDLTFSLPSSHLSRIHFVSKPDIQ